MAETPPITPDDIRDLVTRTQATALLTAALAIRKECAALAEWAPREAGILHPGVDVSCEILEKMAESLFETAESPGKGGHAT